MSDINKAENDNDPDGKANLEQELQDLSCGNNHYCCNTLRYHNYADLMFKLQTLTDEYPELLSLYHLDEKTHHDRQLWVVRLSTEEQGERSDLKPMVKYVANMHGDETVGRELMVYFIEHLVKKYKDGSVST